jgi:hypothetical protein
MQFVNHDIHEYNDRMKYIRSIGHDIARKEFWEREWIIQELRDALLTEGEVILDNNGEYIKVSGLK